MKKIVALLFILVFVLLGAYLLLPTPDIYELPPGALKSQEPADTETKYRFAFFTDLTREEIMQYYIGKYHGPLQIRQNHPPEDAATVIRDQTLSNYLEELLHPGKDSLYINGFVPSKPEERIIRNDKVYLSKVTVHFVPSSIPTRLTVLLMVAVVSYLLLNEYRHV